MAGKKGFDLGSLLANVSESDTSREQIEYIDLDLIDADAKNFYSMSDLEDLASNIAMIGLQQPLRIRPNPDAPDRYSTISGHRRRAALGLLAKENPERWKQAACIVERGECSEALQQLKLIFGNAHTRKLSAADLSEQAVQVEELLYKLKEEGYEFPGRMRDHVAAAVNASTSKLARLKVIREGLVFEWKIAFQNSELTESSAYELARMPAPWQRIIFNRYGSIPRRLSEAAVNTFRVRFERISKVRCDISGNVVCTIQSVMMGKSCDDPFSDPCSAGCCLKCVSLQTCRTVCAGAVDAQKEKRMIAKEAARGFKEEIAQRNALTLEYIRGVYGRVGQARTAKGVSIRALYEAQRVVYSASTDDKKQLSLENGTAKISAYLNLPFGYNFTADKAAALCRVADLLDVSTDYLLGRTKDFRPGGWRTGDPIRNGDYVVRVQFGQDSPISTENMQWDGKWLVYGTPVGAYAEILCWIETPEESQDG